MATAGYTRPATYVSMKFGSKEYSLEFSRHRFAMMMTKHWTSKSIRKNPISIESAGKLTHSRDNTRSKGGSGVQK